MSGAWLRDPWAKAALALLALLVVAVGAGAFLDLRSGPSGAAALPRDTTGASAPSEPSSSVFSDEQAREVLQSAVRTLREDPGSATTLRPGVVARYASSSGEEVRGTFAAKASSGRCWVTTVTATRQWVRDGDPSGLRSSAPAVGAASACS